MGLAFAIETRALTKRYPHQMGLSALISGASPGATAALSDVTLNVNEGEIFGLLGPNGSGKTTFLKLLSTILSPTSGTAEVFGKDIREKGREIRSLVSLVTGEERSLYWRLTARQNLEFFARLYRLDGVQIRHKVDELLELFDLRNEARVRVGEFSTGMKQRLAIARGLLSGPKLLFLDEPTRGLDPIAAHSLLEGVKARAVDHFANTVILTTHIMREVEQLCERIAVLNHGTVAYQGTVDGLRLSLERFDRYSLTLRGSSPAALEALSRWPGVNRCERIEQPDGLTELELVFTTSDLELSDILRHLLGNGMDILRCAKREQSLEEMFRAMFDGAGTARPGETNDVAGAKAIESAGRTPA